MSPRSDTSPPAAAQPMRTVRVGLRRGLLGGSWLITLFVVLVLLNGLLPAARAYITAVWLALMGALILLPLRRAAAHHEHILRVPTATNIRLWHPGSRTAPATSLGSIVFFGVATIIGVAITASAFSAAERSDRTQHRGPVIQATVIDVHTVAHYSRGSVWHTSRLRVTLATGGVAMVHQPGMPAFDAGATTQVRVDPDDPGYAELPGRPAASFLGAGVAVLVTAVFAVAAATSVRDYRQARRTKAGGGFFLRG